jgi:molybdopterin synthase catalytic subunit
MHDGDEVAFLPPMSGGAPRCRLVDRAIDLPALEAEVSAARHGAIVTFVGIVRETSPSGRLVRHLEYEAFDEMATREMERVASEIDARWPDCSLVMEHRTGCLAIGEASVAILVAAPHRAAAFDACRYAIDRIKEIVPIWKKEVFDDGSQWVGIQA